MSFSFIDLQVESSIATITLNRPDKRNAMSDAMRGEFIQALEKVAADKAIKALVLTDARAWAAEMGKGSATALALSKTILNQSFELSSHDVFAQGSQAQGICYTSTEHRESVTAFLARSATAVKE
ncbi:MAG TPA: enoyl-CoA hydratase-related protein [Burkholderiaceae bacterium]|jgi:enoyl-CoA hydratase/carnithine racemase|nr:enoyl-CoA hydratase-related protein [Burkholderiaceae bacterium]